MGLDSLYAMLARPVKAVLEPKRVVEQVQTSHELAPDSHESPQSQLPPKVDTKQQSSDRRNPQQDRRRGTKLNRRKSDLINAEEERKRELEIRAREAAAKGHIDIEV